jgi:hypothetical protein
MIILFRWTQGLTDFSKLAAVLQSSTRHTGNSPRAAMHLEMSKGISDEGMTRNIEIGFPMDA